MSVPEHSKFKKRNEERKKKRNFVVLTVELLGRWCRRKAVKIIFVETRKLD